MKYKKKWKKSSLSITANLIRDKKKHSNAFIVLQGVGTSSVLFHYCDASMPNRLREKHDKIEKSCALKHSASSKGIYSAWRNISYSITIETPSNHIDWWSVRCSFRATWDDLSRFSSLMYINTRINYSGKFLTSKYTRKIYQTRN